MQRVFTETDLFVKECDRFCLTGKSSIHIAVFKSNSRFTMTCLTRNIIILSNSTETKLSKTSVCLSTVPTITKPSLVEKNTVLCISYYSYTPLCCTTHQLKCNDLLRFCGKVPRKIDERLCWWTERRKFKRNKKRLPYFPHYISKLLPSGERVEFPLEEL